ncbi:MAG: GNAT family N-acetyltransferase [Actinobacteria bacterium]|nr:GNAT family N-acetyltransferase [Actinomycetota bacterium]
METGTLTWRAVTPDDAPALVRAHAAVEAVDVIGEHRSEQDVRDELGETADPGRDTFAGIAEDGEVVAFARVHSSAQVHDVDWVELDGFVLPAARGGGLGRRLLEWARSGPPACTASATRTPRGPSASTCTRTTRARRRWSGPRAMRRGAGGTRWSAAWAIPCPTFPRRRPA